MKAIKLILVIDHKDADYEETKHAILDKLRLAFAPDERFDVLGLTIREKEYKED